VTETVRTWASSPWVLAPAALVLWVGVFLIVKTIVIGAMRRVAARTRWTWDDVFVRALSTPLLITILASGLLVFGRILPLEPEWDRAFDVLLTFSIALALVLFVDRAARATLERVSEGSPVLQGARGLIQAGIRGLIVGIGLLIFLDSIGISITPILASLGVGSLAVALALQDTLANFFAGIHILIEEPIALGSFIRLSTGEEGVVTDIGWRTTRLRNGANNVVVIPNTKITSGILINYNLPHPPLAAELAVIAGFDADVDQVRRIALDEARNCEGVLPLPEPAIFFNPGVMLTHLQFTLVFHVSEFNKRAPMQSEVRLRIYRRLRAEGVPLPVVSADMRILTTD